MRIKPKITTQTNTLCSFQHYNLRLTNLSKQEILGRNLVRNPFEGICFSSYIIGDGTNESYIRNAWVGGSTPLGGSIIFI